MKNTHTYKKQILASSFAFAALAGQFMIITPAFAQTTIPTITGTHEREADITPSTAVVSSTPRSGRLGDGEHGNTGVSQSPQISVSGTAAADALQNLQERANKEITRRINALNELITKINGIEKLSTAQKTSYITQIQAQITSLTTLEQKITADTTIDQVRTDVKSIVNEYYIFLFFIPTINLQVAADRLNTTAMNMTTFATKLQARISQLQSQGVNVTTLQTTLADMQAKLSDAQTQYTTVTSTISSLTVAGFPGNKGQLQTALAEIKQGRQDVQTAYQDAKTIIQALMASSKSQTTVSVTPSVTTSSLPTETTMKEK